MSRWFLPGSWPGSWKPPTCSVPLEMPSVCWRLCGAPNEADLARETLASILPYFVFFLPERQQVIGYPISGFDNDLRVGRRRYNFIWYRVG